MNCKILTGNVNFNQQIGQTGERLKTNKKPYEILLEVLNGREIPFIAEFDCAHTHPMLSVPIGCEVELDATNKTIKILGEFQ